MTKTVYQALVELESSKQADALCVIVRSQGSTPRGVGSKMIVYPDRTIVGTVGGGEVENRVILEILCCEQTSYQCQKRRCCLQGER